VKRVSWRGLKSVPRSLSIICFIVCSVILVDCRNNPSSPITPGSMQERLVYVALGASDAVGLGAFPLENGYVYKIRDSLKAYAPNVELHNLGVICKLSEYLESTELPTAIAHQPDVVTIWTGPNDLTVGVDVATFETHLGNIFARLRQQTSALIVMANIPDMTVLPRFQLLPDADVTLERVHAYNAAIVRQTAAYNIPLVDLYAARCSEKKEYIGLDGFHPSNAGYAKMAELYLEQIVTH